MLDWEAIKPHLEAKLDPQNVKPPAPGRFGDYVEGWHVIAEANRIFGFGGWSFRVDRVGMVQSGTVQVFDKWKKAEVTQYRCAFDALVTVTVGDVTRQDIGYGHGQAKETDIGNAMESAGKEAVTDALKRALRTFGNPFGLALYDKTKANVGAPEPASNLSGTEGLKAALRASIAAEIDRGSAETPHDHETGEVRDEHRGSLPMTSDTPQAWIDGIRDKLGPKATKRQLASEYAAMLIAKAEKFKPGPRAMEWVIQFEQTHSAYIDKLPPDLRQLVSAALAAARDRKENPNHDPADFRDVGIRPEDFIPGPDPMPEEYLRG